jgi:hypothetical protein
MQDNLLFDAILAKSLLDNMERNQARQQLISAHVARGMSIDQATGVVDAWLAKQPQQPDMLNTYFNFALHWGLVLIFTFLTIGIFHPASIPSIILVPAVFIGWHLVCKWVSSRK